MDEEFDSVEACGSRGDVVRNAEKISACGSSYSKLDSAIAFLFHDGIVVHDFVAVPSILGNERVGDGNDGPG